MTQDRISSWSVLNGFIEKGTPVQIPFTGTPWSTVTYLPQTAELSLFVETEVGFGESIPPVDILVERANLGARKGWQIKTSRRDLYFHFYCFVCAIVDEMYLRGRSSADAFDVSVASFRDLIEKEAILSTEKQIGLLAELLVLSELSKLRPWNWCLDAWHSDMNAEHDFNLGESDLEVKATLMESRNHMIGSLQQLKESEGRPLFVASFQFTRNDHQDAFKLVEIEQTIKKSVQQTNPELVQRFEDRLKKVGYRQEHARFYRLGVGYRSPNLVFHVDEGFPRIIDSTLVFQVSSNRQRISQITYRINLDNIKGVPLSTFVRNTLGDANG